MICATCPNCFTSSGFLNERALRVTCPACLRTFDPTEPLPEPRKASTSDKIGGLDALVGDEDVEPPDLDIASDSDDKDPDFDEDFDAGT